MIIQEGNDELVDARSGTRWAVVDQGGSRASVTLYSSDRKTTHALYYSNMDDCRAFFDSLADQMNAVRWSAEKRRFVPVTKCPTLTTIAPQEHE